MYLRCPSYSCIAATQQGVGAQVFWTRRTQEDRTQRRFLRWGYPRGVGGLQGIRQTGCCLSSSCTCPYVRHLTYMPLCWLLPVKLPMPPRPSLPQCPVSSLLPNPPHSTPPLRLPIKLLSRQSLSQFLPPFPTVSLTRQSSHHHLV